MPFDPNKYLESKEVEFNPDDYLKKKVIPEADLEVGLEVGGQSTTMDQPLSLGYQRILKAGKIPQNPFEKAALGQPAIDEPMAISTEGKSKSEPAPIKKESIYDLAVTDTEKWYGATPSPRKKIASFNEEAGAIKAKYQSQVDNGLNVDENAYNTELSDLANRLGLTFENGDVNVSQGELDKYQEVYTRKLDERLSRISDAKKNPYIKDVVNKLGAGSAGVLNTPYNVMALSEKAGNALLGVVGVEPSTYWQDFATYLNDNKNELSQNSQRYEDDILTMVKNGDMGSAIGKAGLDMAESLPMLSTLIMGNAAGATKATLGFMGGSKSAEEYMSMNNRKDIGEFSKIVDAVGVGVSEILFEQTGTVKILEGIKKGIQEKGQNIVRDELGKMLQTNLQRNMSLLMQGNSDMIREGVSEAATQLSDNLIKKATVDPNIDIWEGVTDSAIVGGLIGKGINLSLNAANNVQSKGTRKAVTDAIKQVPQNYSLEAKEKIATLTLEKQAIQDKTMDAAKPIQEIVAPQIKAIDEEIKKIAAKEEGIELPKEEKPKEGEKKEPKVVLPKSEVKVSPDGITSLNEEKPIEKPIVEKPVENKITLTEKSPISEDDKAILQLEGDNLFTRQINKDGERLGQITVEETENTWNVKDVVVDEEKKGYGKEVYRQMNDMAQEEGKVISSGIPTKDTSKKATYMWDSLVKSEEAIKNNEDGSYRMLPTKEIVEPKITEESTNASEIRIDPGQNDQGGSTGTESKGISSPNLQSNKEAGAKTGNEEERLTRIKNIPPKLTHIEGLGMGMNQADGVYFSTEKKNRYSKEGKPAKEVVVSVRNPVEFDQQEGAFNEVRTTLLNESKAKFTEGDYLEYKTPQKENLTVGDLNEAGGQVVMEEESFAQQSKGKNKTPPSKEKGIQKPVNPSEKETKKEPTKRWIDEEQVTNEGIKGIEVPELIKMIVKLSGKYPALKNFQKKLGVFYHSEAGDSSIALHRKLFTKDGINMLGKVVAHEFGHFIDFLPDNTLKRGNILGRIASLKEYFTRTLGEKTGKEGTVLTAKDRIFLRKEAERSLKEEYDKGIREIIEEVIKEEPIFEEAGLTTEDILGIWNDNQARENNPELYEYIAKLSSFQKKRIVADALKGLIDTEVLKKFSKGKQVGVKLTKEFIKKTVTPKPVDSISIREKYRELLREEINKRRLFESEVVRDELEALTKWWNPYDEGMDAAYTEYRKSGKELYAEALSVLLNNPEAIAERAPFFNRAFFNYFPNKPNVKQVYDEIQDLISKPKEVLQQDRLNRVYDGFKTAEAKRQQISKQEKAPKLSGWNKFLKDYVSLIIPIIRKIPEPRKLTMQLNDRQVLRDYLEKLAFANEKVAVMLVDMEKNVNQELEKAGLSVDDFSALLEVERNISQRTDIANPYAFQQIASSELKAFIESKFTGEQKETMDRVKQTFHNKVFDIMENAYKAGMFTPEQYEYISKFKDSYATFQVVDYIDKNSVAAGFKKATGTLKEVESPYISTLFKVASVIKGIERQNAVNAFVDAYAEYLPGEVTESEQRRINGISVGFKDAKDKGRIEYYKNGKWSGLDVDPYIAEFFDMNKPSDLGQLITLFHYFNKGFKPLVTTWNVGWAFFSNIFRDHPRTFYNTFAILASTEGMSKVDALKLPLTYFKSLVSIMPDAKKFVQGELTPLIEDMIDEGVLRHGFFGSYDPHAEESIGPVFQAAGMIKKDQSIRDKMAERSRVLKFGLKILGGIEFAGQILEVSSKMTAFNLLQQNLGDSKSAGFYTRNYAGTPNYLDKGTHTRTTNEVFTFSNVILQSIRTDSEIAFKPQTRGAYWSAQAISVVTPAALMALAAGGLFGDELKDLYGQITEYEKTNFLCVIWGKTADGKPVYTKIPIPEFSRVTHGITYKTMAALLGGEGISKPEQLLALGSSLTPSPSPLIKTGMGWSQYISNKNPYDFFFGSNVLTDREQEARGWPALKKMITWSIKNMGGGFITKFYDYDPIKNNTTEYILKNTPLVGRVIKIGGYGQSETLSGIGGEVRSQKAKESLKLDKTINEYVIKALSEGKDMTTSGDIMDEMKKEIYGTDKISPEQNKEFSYTKKKFKTKLVKGIKSPFSNTVSAIVDSKSNDEKVAKLQEYTLIYGEDKFIELINYLSSQELISDALRSKVKDMVENIDLDEQKRDDIIQTIDQYNGSQSGSRIIPQ